jgi:hypothetical protein
MTFCRSFPICRSEKKSDETHKWERAFIFIITRNSRISYCYCMDAWFIFSVDIRLQAWKKTYIPI